MYGCDQLRGISSEVIAWLQSSLFKLMGETHREDHLRKGSSVSVYEALVAGSISGAVARAITAPLDTIKIRLQLQRTPLAVKSGAIHTVKNLFRNEGVAALWKGNVPAEIMYILYGATQFTSYSVINSAVADVEAKFPSNHKLSPAANSLIVGSGAGISSTLVTYPFDLLRTRLAANTSTEFLSMSEVVQEIWRKEGALGIFAGIRPTLLSVAANTGLMFWSYEMAREMLSRHRDNLPFVEGICGFIAGTTSKGLTFPLDTVRKRSQVFGMTNAHLGPPNAYRIFTNIIKKEGALSLYRGFGISLLKTAPTSAISLFTYEYSLDMIRHLSNKAL